jgi:hypothetical protein
VSKLDAIPLVVGQESHGITVDQFNFREVERDDTARRQRRAKDIQVFSGNPATDAKNDALFKRKSVDSAGHGRVGRCPLPQWQTRRQPQFTEKAAKDAMRSLAAW